MDAKTLLNLGGPGIQNPTFTLLLKGPQVAGTPLVSQLTQKCALRYAYAKGVGIFLSKTRIVYTSLPTSTWINRPDIIAVLEGSVSSQWAGRVEFAESEYLWLDSTAAMGGSDFCVAVFEIG